MIDSHCHINDQCFANQENQYIEEASRNGVKTFLVVGYDLQSSLKAIEIASQNNSCYSAIGIHPSEVKKASNKDICELEKMLSNNKIIAIGEIGLDYYWDKGAEIKSLQKRFFIEQIELANKYNLPISIHCRDAYEDCLNILKNNPVKRGGIMHCYGGSSEMMKEFIKLGFLIGIGGVVTFKNAVKMKEVALNVPSDKYVLETDAPYLAPTPHRGEQNRSKYLFLIRDEIAKIRNTTSEEVDGETTTNFKGLFGL